MKPMNIYRLLHVLFFPAGITITILLFAGGLTAQSILYINEFMADNDNIIADPQGDFDDWLEIWNGGGVTVDLSGFTLTDDLANPTKWSFPDTSLSANAYLIVWADEDTGDPGLHANFRLSANGEEIGLFKDESGLISLIDSVVFGPQPQDVAYARYPDGSSQWQFAVLATPGYSNNSTALPDIENLQISVEDLTVHLSWEAIPLAESYKIFRSNQPYFQPSALNLLVEVTDTAYSDSQIIASSTTQFYSVISCNTVAGSPQLAEMIAPSRVTLGHPLPVAVIIPEINSRIDYSQTFRLQADSSGIAPDEFVVKRGRGSVYATLDTPGFQLLELYDDAGNLFAISGVLVEEQPTYRELSGILSGDELIWNSAEVIHLTGDVTIPSGSLLTIQPGARIELDQHVCIVVQGEIISQGTPAEPVFFTSHLPGIYWGEIDHAGSNGSYYYTFFTEGGGDSSQAYGHSNSQPVISGWAPDLLLDNVYILDNPGKAMGLGSATLEMNSSLISRCDTGGELHHTLAHIQNCYYLDIPDNTGIPLDDDNDALYLQAAWSGGDDSTQVNNCVFITGTDDGIDHNGANVLIRECVIDDYYSEGIAASNANNIEIFNTLIVNCYQGIEAGYGSPAVFVNHCTLVGNEIGLRFGDEYNTAAEGTLTVINSIVDNSLQYNVWNWDQSIQGPIPDAIFITYSIVNQPPYDQGEGCATGTPIFTVDYNLAPASPGIGIASDSLDMGILPIEY